MNSKLAKQIAKECGATHYTAAADNQTPQMFYKQVAIHGEQVWHYLSYTGSWFISHIATATLESRLIKLPE
jgi:hypothetical protein